MDKKLLSFIVSSFIGVLLVLTPGTTFAQTYSVENIFNPVKFGSLGGVIQAALPIIFSLTAFLAVVVFALGAVRYIISRGDSKAAESARGTMTGAVIGLVIVLGSAAVSAILSATLGLGLFGENTPNSGAQNGVFDLRCAFNIGSDCVGNRYENPGTLVTDILLLIVSVGAVAFFFMLLWSGIRYMAARGDEKAVSEARGSLANAFVGLLLLIAAFVIIRLVANLFGFSEF